MRHGTPAYPQNSDADVRAINAETRDRLIDRELWDAADEFDWERAFPTRPSDAELMPSRDGHLTLKELDEMVEDDRRRSWHPEMRRR